MTLDISGITSILASLNSTVAGGLAALTPAQLGAIVGGAGSLIGPSQAEIQLGRDLDLYAKFAVKGWAGDLKAADMALNIQISANEIAGLPSNVTLWLNAVWAAKDEAALMTAITQAKLAAGLAG